MQEIYRVKTSPVALSDNMIIGEKYRITVLTEALVRLEYSEDGVFEDRATQTVLFRDFPKTGYHVVRNADGIEVHTSMLHLIYNEKEFSSHGLSIQIKGNLSAYHSIWHYGEKVHDLLFHNFLLIFQRRSGRDSPAVYPAARPCPSKRP